MKNRIVIYLKEMFPISYIVLSFLYTLVVLLTLHEIYNIDFEFKLVYFFTGCSLLCLLLIIRVMDEFKDYQDDLINYPERPLPSNRVYHEDLKFLMNFLIGLGLLISLTNKYLLLSYLGCLGFSFLMFKWFFIEEKMRKSLPLAFVSHHPIVFFYLFLIFSPMMLEYSITSFKELWVLIPIGLLSTNWEISRKLRSPAKETFYTTYSKIWGSKRACSIALMISITFTSLFLVYFIQEKRVLSFSCLYLVVSIVLYTPYVRFIKDDSLVINFKEKAEILSVFNQISLLVFYFL